MRIQWLAAGVVIGMGCVACSGSPAVERRPGPLARGSASVTIGARAANTLDVVSCDAIGSSYTRIVIGSQANGVDAVVDNAAGLSAKSVVINSIDGFTGSYWQGVQGTAQTEQDDGHYVFYGTAAGYDNIRPYAVMTNDYRIDVVC